MNKVLLFIGTLLLILPIGIKMWNANKQDDIIGNYEEKLDWYGDEDILKSITSAKEYNQKLFETNVVDLTAYEQELNLFETGMMGSIHIPKIELKLPIYHGTEERVLSHAVGHLKESSLPIGGENTHCVLSGHRGVPEAQLFTRLDELEKGDAFYISVHNEKLSYRVCDITVVEPNNVNALKREKGKDLVSLVTCTPYGINTHRLIVTGERIVEDVKEQESGNGVLSVRDVGMLLLPIPFLITAKMKSRKRGEKNV